MLKAKYPSLNGDTPLILKVVPRNAAWYVELRTAIADVEIPVADNISRNLSEARAYAEGMYAALWSVGVRAPIVVHDSTL
jgi:hypothetical protein